MVSLIFISICIKRSYTSIFQFERKFYLDIDLTRGHESFDVQCMVS